GALNYALCLDLTDCRPAPPLIHLRPEEAGGTESLAREVAEAVCMVMDSPIGRFRVYCKQPVSPEV
uniref:hypothetical protein n=1 Tax=Desulfohalovibrio reitneri TaxID=1307759 RepID=UPI00055969CD